MSEQSETQGTIPEHRAPMEGATSVSRPLQRVAADILELPLTSRGNRYVLIMDYITKFVNVYPLPNQTAETVAHCLFEDYVLVHGIPEDSSCTATVRGGGHSGTR